MKHKMLNKKLIHFIALFLISLLFYTYVVYKNGWNYYPVYLELKLKSDALNDISVEGFSPWNSQRKLDKYGNNYFYTQGLPISKLEIRGKDAHLIEAAFSRYNIMGIDLLNKLEFTANADNVLIIKDLGYNQYNIFQKSINWKGDIFFIIQVLFFSILTLFAYHRIIKN